MYTSASRGVESGFVYDVPPTRRCTASLIIFCTLRRATNFL
jgi:hypothetical protein